MCSDSRPLPLKSKNRRKQSGFTLIELLIVIAIIGILGTVVVIVLNPTEFVKQARDSTRLSNIDLINKALSTTQIDNLALGNANTIYVSMPDTLSNCGNLGLPILPSGWSYACVTSANLRKTNGTGWIPINLASYSIGSPISVLPVDSINSSLSNLYYIYFTANSIYTIKAQAFESAKYSPQYPNGYALSNNPALTGPYVYPQYWVSVPGNGSYGTSNFYVMKYDAKCVQISNNTPLTSPDTGYHTYSDSGQPCAGSNYYVASTPDGYPIANISHNTALSYCTALGAHLLTNDEYMTIMRNAEQVSSNWSGGSPGSGYLYSGHNDNTPAYALTADTNDANGYAGETNTGGNQRRTLMLSNSSVVWDFAGNVWQHVQRSVMNSGDLTTTMALPTCSNGASGLEWCQYGSALTPYISAWSSDVAQANVGPSNTSWNSSQSVGQVYTYGIGGNQGTNVFFRSGSWNYDLGVGAFTLNLGWVTGTLAYTLGFRCAR